MEIQGDEIDKVAIEGKMRKNAGRERITNVTVRARDNNRETATISTTT